MPRIEPFEQHPDQYEHWFEEHPAVFEAEVRAIRALIPRTGRGLEVGVGTGRFADALGIDDGIDPSPEMRRRAQQRGLRVADGTAEALPFEDAQFDYVLLVTTICFVDDVAQTLAEAYRVLKPSGALIIGMVDRDSALGQQYEAQKEKHDFYHAAHFHTTDALVSDMRTAGFQSFAFRQTLFRSLETVDEQEPVRSGYGDGAFVVIRGRKPFAEQLNAHETNGQSTQAERSEIRYSHLTGRDVVIAPTRGGRPRETEVDDAEATGPHPSCPFCPGNEARLPYVVDEQPATDDKAWQTRVVPNKFAALTPSGMEPAASDELHVRQAAHGRQEVIIETPEHGRDLADLSAGAVETVVATYQQRMHAIRAADPALMPFVFRNYGAEAGASIAHAHSQLIATAYEPPAVQAEAQRARRYFDQTGRCLGCDIATREADGPRRVLESESFVAVVPFSAEVPCEVLILPKAHPTSFVAMEDAARSDFARVLRTVLRRVRKACGDPSYNFYVRDWHQPDGAAPHLHWYLRLVPRISVQAGFELSTDLRINPSSPERDARQLRGE